MKTDSRPWRRRRWLSVACVTLSGCSAALHPHRTLDGQPFRWDRLDAITAGTSEAELLTALGRPLEVSDVGPDVTVWRYHERAQLRGCKTEVLGFIPWGDTPVRTVDLRVALRAGVVERVDVTRK